MAKKWETFKYEGYDVVDAGDGNTGIQIRKELERRGFDVSDDGVGYIYLQDKKEIPRIMKLLNSGRI